MSSKNQHKGNNFNGKKEPSSLRFREIYTIHPLSFLMANSLQNERKFQVFLTILHRGQNDFKNLNPEVNLLHWIFHFNIQSHIWHYFDSPIISYIVLFSIANHVYVFPSVTQSHQTYFLLRLVLISSPHYAFENEEVSCFHFSPIKFKNFNGSYMDEN